MPAGSFAAPTAGGFPPQRPHGCAEVLHAPPAKGNWSQNLWALFLIALCICNGETESLHESSGKDVPIVIPSVIRTIPHDTAAFTQGLLYHDSKLYESTGLYGKSSLRMVNPKDGDILYRKNIDAALFGEGLARDGDHLVLLTWKAQVALVYRLEDLKQVATRKYAGEGWGLTHDKRRFIMSDGSDTLYFRDSLFTRTGSIAVTYKGKPLSKLNELEYARGMVFANVWYSDMIFGIDPNTGEVEKVINCTFLVRRAGVSDPKHVLNGIAYEPSSGHLFVTGKNWPTVFVIDVPEKQR